jgi:pimeloyl-ACP methyl ester carboxylesterase
MTGMPESTEFTVRLADGRTLAAMTAGPADGLPFVFQPGTPSGLVAYPPMIDAAAARGLRLVTYSRPGYGGSDPASGRRVAGAAADLAAVLGQLGQGAFVTAGWSGGGPHALASAALLPGRCLAAASVAGVAPLDAGGLDWMAGMAPENVAEFEAAIESPAAITAFLEAAAGPMSEVTAGQVAAELGQLASPADVRSLTGEFAEYLAASFRAALSSGIAGWRDDDLAFAAGWGFEPGQITVPVSVWQGDQDAMVPFAHGQWLAGAISGARSHLLPGHGHLTLIKDKIGAILDELTALAGLG